MPHAPRYTVVNVTEDGACECCGRASLRRVVHLHDAHTGTTTAMGTTCAARHLGTTSRAVTLASRRASVVAGQVAEDRARAGELRAMPRDAWGAYAQRNHGQTPPMVAHVLEQRADAAGYPAL